MEKNCYEPSKIMNYLYEKDYENKVYVHCTNSLPKFVSINNSILICSTCYLKHLSLGYNISYVRELKDEWDQYLLNFLERGGNSRYIRFCNQYDLNQMPIEEKLKTKILDYYRLLVSKNLLIFNIFFNYIDKNGSFS
jgi:ADP-ribosylation factor GTPase-activating protein 1